jgi:hypothetical protein
MKSFEQEMEDRSMSYAGDETDAEIEKLERLIQADRDRRFEAMLEAEEKRQREAVKRACLKGLLDLGILPRSLVRERYDG